MKNMSANEAWLIGQQVFAELKPFSNKGWGSSMGEIALLIGRIEDAWGDGPCPTQITKILKVREEHPEVLQAKEKFCGKAWRTVPDDVLLATCPSPFLIGSEPVCYYLGALMLAAVRNPDSLLMEDLIAFQLLPPKNARKLQGFAARFRFLSIAQRSVVAAFLQKVAQLFYSESPRTQQQIDFALKSYWQTPPT